MQSLYTYENKNILITGGAGFIGHYLIKKLLQQKSNVYVLDNLSTGKNENLPDHPDLHFFNDSVLNNSWINSFSNISFDLIIHLASVVGMKLATKYQHLVYETATEGTLNVLNAFPDVPVVLFSSSAVYGIENILPVSESQEISYEQLLQYDGGTKGYACGKWKMEQIGLAASGNGRKVIIVRPFNVIGYKQVNTYGMVVPTLIDQAISGTSLTVFGDGCQVRSFSYVKTFTECFFKLLSEKDAWRHGNNIFNIGTPAGSSINELALIVLKETNSRSLIKYSLYHEIFPHHNDVLYRVPDVTHGEKYFGKTQWPSLQQIVNRIATRKKLADNVMIS